MYNLPIGSRYLLRMVLEVKVLPENGLGGSKDIRFGWSWTYTWTLDHHRPDVQDPCRRLDRSL